MTNIRDKTQQEQENKKDRLSKLLKQNIRRRKEASGQGKEK